jgi:hypothetical protein
MPGNSKTAVDIVNSIPAICTVDNGCISDIIGCTSDIGGRMTDAYYKLAAWDERLATFRDGKAGYATEAGARAAATKPGRYRVSTVTPAGRTDGEPFEVAGTVAGAAKPKRQAGGLRDRPGPWLRT